MCFFESSRCICIALGHFSWCCLCSKETSLSIWQVILCIACVGAAAYLEVT